MLKKAEKSKLAIYEEIFGQLMKKDEVNIKKLIAEAATNRWNGIKGGKIEIIAGAKKFIIDGTIIEEIYEYFVGDTNVYLEENGIREVLLEVSSHTVAPYKIEVKRTGSVDDVLEKWKKTKAENVFVKYTK